MQNFQSLNIQLLQQLNTVLLQLSLEDYSLPLKICSYATIGQHTRHIINFYNVFIERIDDHKVCYDNRERNSDLETKKDIASLHIKKIMVSLETECINREIVILSTITGNKEIIKSSVARELLFILDHTVHHLAMIKMAIKTNFDYIEFPKNFGIAQSTIDYKKKCAL